MAARLTAYVVVVIVAGTLIAGLIVGAQRDDNDGPVDLIVRNAKVYTADRRGQLAEAVAIRGNQILRVGTDREIARLQRPQTTVIDARGAAVLPGFNDAKADVIAGGLGLLSVDLTGAVTAAEMVQRLIRWQKANTGADWIVGRGWSRELFKGAIPPRFLLDSAVPDRPVVLYGADEASVWVNSEALRLAGIHRKSPDPGGGTIVREGRGHEPSGILTGTAAALVTSLVPAPKLEERARALRSAMSHANSLGITSVQHTVDGPDALGLYDSMRRGGELTVRVYAAVAIPDVAYPRSEADLAAFEATRTRYPDDPLFKTGALSIRLDGPVRARDAAMLQPYHQSAQTGDLRFDPDALNRMVRLADAAGWQVITEANGDRAVRVALNAYAHAVRSNRPPARGRRHRLENAVVVSPPDVGRFGPLGVTASLQPSRGTPTPERIQWTETYLGAERAAASFPLASIAEQTRVLFGSGWPVHTLSPLEALHVAVSQTTPEGTPEGGWHKAERMDLKAALDAYTSTPAWASFDDQRKGVLAPGMLADLVVLSDDIFERPEELADVAVSITIFDGKVVYRRAPPAETAPVPSPQH
jgi:predicted amidohydrolase YtcJ